MAHSGWARVLLVAGLSAVLMTAAPTPAPSASAVTRADARTLIDRAATRKKVCRATSKARRGRNCRRLRFRTLRLKRGQRLTVSSVTRTLQIDGTMSLPSGASIVANGQLTILAKRNVTVGGTIRSTGGLRFLLSRNLTVRGTIASAGSLRFSSRGRRRVWKASGRLAAGDPALARLAARAAAAPVALKKGGKGKKGTPGKPYEWDNPNGTVELHGRNGRQLQLSAGSGGAGQDVTGCGVEGGDGGDGGRFVIRAAVLVMGEVFISGGDGGSGGSARGTNCKTGDVNRGGHGGKPGNYSVFGRALRFAPDVYPGVKQVTYQVKAFYGGRGGDAEITGADGTTPGDADGQSPEAIGGDGNTPPTPDFDLVGARPKTVNEIIDAFNAGAGGNATATGGNGAAGAPCGDYVEDGMVRAGGRGGKGLATGGAGGTIGGKPIMLKPPAPTTVPGFLGGTGGNATATGGKGGKGSDCPKAGLAGGNGGAATATVGTPGGFIPFTGKELTDAETKELARLNGLARPTVAQKRRRDALQAKQDAQDAALKDLEKTLVKELATKAGKKGDAQAVGGDGGPGGDGDLTTGTGGPGGLCGAPKGKGGPGGKGKTPGATRPDCP